LLLSIKASGAGLNLHWNCSDIIVACVAENINMVLQALGRAHRIGQLRSQRVWVVTQDHSYDQLLQAAQTKKMLQQIAGEGLIELDDADFEINDDQIEDETADIIDDNERRDKANKLREEALFRKGRAIQAQSEEIIARMMGQRCSRLDWDSQKNLKLKDKVEQVQATPARVRVAPLPGVQPVPLSLGRYREPHVTEEACLTRNVMPALSLSEQARQDEQRREKEERAKVQREESARHQAERDRLDEEAATRHRARAEVEAARAQAEEAAQEKREKEKRVQAGNAAKVAEQKRRRNIIEVKKAAAKVAERKRRRDVIEAKKAAAKTDRDQTPSRRLTRGDQAKKGKDKGKDKNKGKGKSKGKSKGKVKTPTLSKDRIDPKEDAEIDAQVNAAAAREAMAAIPSYQRRLATFRMSLDLS